MGTHSQAIRIKRRTAIVVSGAAVLIMLVISACRLDRYAIPPPYTFSVVPTNVCPNDTVTVEWSFRNGEQSSGCEGIIPRSAPDSTCRTVRVKQDDAHIAGAAELRATRTISVPYSTIFTFQGFDAMTPLPESPESRMVHVIEISEESIPVTYKAECRSHEIEYVAFPPIENVIGPCAAVQGIVSGEDLILTNTDTGETDYLSAGTPSDAFGTIATNLDVAPAGEPVYDGAHPCTTDNELAPGEERAPMPHDITLYLTVTCSIPSGAADCGPYPIMSEPGEGDTGPATFCNVEETCGDGVCDSPCEDPKECAADCSEEEPAIFVFCGSACTSNEECAGLGVNPICAGGQCYDAATCEPDQSGSPGGGNEGGGGSSGGQAVCGNGKVEAGEACDGFKNGSCDWDQQYCTNSCSCDTLD